MSISAFPTINASLNALAACFLISGWWAIKNKNPGLHKKLMVCALCVSFLFLCSYVTYHYLSHSVTRYQGDGILRIIYFAVLLTHTPLAMIIVPFCIAAVVHAIRGNFEKHTRITRWLMPVWLYVSITGVIIYLMLYVFPPVSA